jgi:hypothetical protein
MISTIQRPIPAVEAPDAEHVAVHRQTARLMTVNEAGQWRSEAEWLLILADAEIEDYPPNITVNSRLNAHAIVAAVDLELDWRKHKGIAHPADSPRWDKAFLDDLKARVSIQSQVEQTVALQRSGARLKGLCPFHPDKHPSLVVYPDDGGWHCFGCGAHGDVITWAIFVNRMDFREAVHLLAAFAGVDVPSKKTPTNVGATRRRVVQIGNGSAARNA